MRTPLLFLFLLTGWLTSSSVIYSQETAGSRYNITYITMDNGLNHNFIDDIYKDEQGFLWVSTGGGGLSRYDGYEFIHYNTNTPQTKLKSNFIRKVCEDDFGRLWIISEGGTDILDLNLYRMTIPEQADERFYKMVSESAANLIKDSTGAMWVLTAGSVYRISFNNRGGINEIATFALPPLPLQSTGMADIEENGNIWMGIANKVVRLSPQPNGGIKETLISPLLEFVPNTLIFSLLIKENEVWIGTNWGLARYNRNEEVSKHYQQGPSEKRSITQNYVTDLAVTSDKQLFISTLRGINIYNPINDNFEHITQESMNGTSCLNSDFINCMLVDNDIIWIGTETGGLNKITARRLSVRNYSHKKDDPHSLSRNLVNAIYEDTNNNLWIGTVEGGLNQKEKGKDRFKHYTTDYPAYLTHNSVSAITEDDNKQLWVGTWGNGISALNINHPDKRSVKHVTSYTHPGYPIDFIGSLCYDPINKGLWIGGNHGIYFYDIQADTVFTPLPDNIARNIHGSIGILIDRKNRLWMGSMEGIFVIDITSGKDNLFSYKYLKYKLDDPESRLVEKTSCFYEADDGTLWIGSNGYGIYKCITDEENNDKFISYTTSDGLINNNVRGILEDDRGNLWISTNNGLSCLDTNTNRFTNYTHEDGLAGNQFYWNAYCRSKAGTLYFGSINGLTAIENNLRPVETPPTKVTFTKLSVANEQIRPGKGYIEKDISIAPILKLHEKDKSFSLEFSALDFKPLATSAYSYRLDGFDNQWISVPANRRFASYTNIPPGKYTFQVKYTPDGGGTESPVTEINVIVSPFFYKTPWFIFIVISSILLIVFYAYRRRIRILQQQKDLLHNTVEERTHELKEQKLILENQTRELSRQNDILIQQNEKITRQKTQLIHMSKKIQALTLDKLAFFTNITHEFRTPITLIIGPIERALKLSYNPQVIEQLNFVERNSKYLLSLVNQLMDFRKVESGKLEIVKSRGNFTDFIQSLIVPFEIFAGERNITIRRFYHIHSPEFLFDQDAMQKVVTNLLSNAIKFTPDGGIVTVYVAVIKEKGTTNEKLYISIKDTGTGISEEDLPRIFNRFYQARNHVKFPVYGQSGTGIGLYLCKRIVKLQGGFIKAYNNKKAGSTFRILLPLQRDEQILHESISENTDPTNAKTVQENAIAHTPGRITILVVEDNKDMRSYIRSILTEHYNVVEAENGEEALNILTTRNIDFIISDLMMPVMDGIELSRKVKENFSISHIPFLMLTAKTSQESRIESYKTGVDEYLLKPFNEELLLIRISNILENRKRYQRQFANNMDIDALHIEEESGDKKFLNKALEIIHENYKNSYYEASDFIDAMGVSKSLLNKKLQNLTGQSIGQFIRNYRLNVARELIDKNRITKNMNISEIAYEVGFNDPKYFTRCFTKRFNVPPSSLLDEN